MKASGTLVASVLAASTVALSSSSSSSARDRGAALACSSSNEVSFSFSVVFILYVLTPALFYLWDFLRSGTSCPFDLSVYLLHTNFLFLHFESLCLRFLLHQNMNFSRRLRFPIFTFFYYKFYGCLLNYIDWKFIQGFSSFSGKNSAPKEKFTPRFDGLRFIETLVTAHRWPANSVLLLLWSRCDICLGRPLTDIWGVITERFSFFLVFWVFLMIDWVFVSTATNVLFCYLLLLWNKNI